MRDVFPALRFHNDGLVCERVRIATKDVPARIELELSDGAKQTISVQGKTAEEIVSALQAPR